MNQAHIFATYIAQSNLEKAQSLLRKHDIYAQNQDQAIEGLKQLLKNEHTFSEVIAIHPDKELFDYTPYMDARNPSPSMPSFSRIDGEPTEKPKVVENEPKNSNSIKVEIPFWLIFVAFLWLVYKLFTKLKPD